MCFSVDVKLYEDTDIVRTINFPIVLSVSYVLLMKTNGIHDGCCICKKVLALYPTVELHIIRLIELKEDKLNRCVCTIS